MWYSNNTDDCTWLLVRLADTVAAAARPAAWLYCSYWLRGHCQGCTIQHRWCWDKRNCHYARHHPPSHMHEHLRIPCYLHFQACCFTPMASATAAVRHRQLSSLPALPSSLQQEQRPPTGEHLARRLQLQWLLLLLLLRHPCSAPLTAAPACACHQPCLLPTQRV